MAYLYSHTDPEIFVAKNALDDDEGEELDGEDEEEMDDSEGVEDEDEEDM